MSSHPGAGAFEPGRREQERSRRTRRRIVESAYQLFSEGGYGTTLAQVAARAGVSVQNVYVTFQNKRNLARAALELAVHGPSSDDLPPHEQAWFEELQAAATAGAAVRIWVENTLPVYERVAPLAAMFVSEPDLAEAWSRSEKLRLHGFRQAMTAIAPKGVLRNGHDIESAVQVMFVLLGPFVYREFRRLGWAPERWCAWAADTVTRAVFET